MKRASNQQTSRSSVSQNTAHLDNAEVNKLSSDEQCDKD